MTPETSELISVLEQLIDAAEAVLANNTQKIRFSASDLTLAIHKAKQTIRTTKQQNAN